MKRWALFSTIVALGIATLVWSERRPVAVRVTPASLLYFIADSEWELSRLPVAATRLSDREEIEIGNELARNNSWYLQGNTQQTPEEKQQIRVVREYVNRVGARVAARAHRKLPYKFHYIPNMDLVNAFALPGGHVYIGAGLVALMDSEDELAAVLGHEVEHIDHYHCAERVQTEQRLRRIPFGSLMAIPISIVEAGYSKDQEMEADREGTTLAVWAGYSPLGAVRMFETFDRLYREYVRRAQSPEEELSQVAIDTLEGYFRSHPLPSERIEQIQKLIAQNNWGGQVRERDLEVAYIFWTKRAQQADENGHYDVAARLAQHSLEMRPGQLSALKVVGDADFAQADFAQASAAFRQALDVAPTDDELIRSYGDALAARHTSAQSLQEFTDWSTAGGGPPNRERSGRLEVRLELARLTMAARGTAAADAVLFPAVSPNASSLPPLMRGRYGWWMYELGQYDSAANWLHSAVEELPGVAVLQIRLGWTLIEQHNLEAAIQRFQTAAAHYPEDESQKQRRRSFNDRRVGLAVAEWQAQQFDAAVSEFTGATQAEPEWLNPRWVAALYSPGVAKTLEALKAEQQKRRGSQARRVPE